MEDGLRKKIDYLYADCTEDYRIPMECMPGDTVEFRLRAPKTEKMKAVLLVGEERFPMEAFREKGCFSWYRVSLPVMERQWSLYEVTFEDETGTETVYYGAEGVKNRPEECFPFVVTPGFITPAWSRGAVYYQIYVDRFCQGNPMNDVLTDEYAYINGFHSERVTDWNSLPQMMDVHRFYGGDLQGVRKKLDYLQYLGVEVLYFNPLFVSPSNHKYDTQDYDAIDPHFTVLIRDEGELLSPGSADNREATRYICRSCDKANLEASNAWFASFVKEVHARGMKIVLDGVFNHCGSFNKWMDKERIYEGRPGYEPGAFLTEDSPYHDYFYFEEGSKWPCNPHFTGWWNHPTLPKLNYENSKDLHDYILRVARKWLAPPYSVDGWRLDVAADLGDSSAYNHLFWKEFRKVVKEENPDAVIIAEHYGNPEHWLRGDEWDTVMNYDAFMEPVGYFLTGLEKHCDSYDGYLHGNGRAFFENMTRAGLNLPSQSLYSAMNELSNHDHARFLTRTNRVVGRLADKGSAAASEGLSYATFREGIVMQFTLPGAPTIYYGDETGVTGWTDPDNRRTFPWGNENWDLIAFHRDVIRMHKQWSCFRMGSFKPIEADMGYLAYGRFDERSSALVLINHSDKAREVCVPVSEIEVPDFAVMRRVMKTDEMSYNVGNLQVAVEEGFLKRTVEAWSAEVYVVEKQ
jgi:alpha-glucosidase